MRFLISVSWNLFSWSLTGFVILLFNLFLLHLYAIYPCNWPCPECTESKWLRVLILTDVHLLGKRKGHPVDQFTREWEMSIAFQMAKNLRQPDMIIFLGDLLDEGLTVDQDEFIKHVERFKNIFPIEENTSKIFVVGNHDIGFHDRIAAYPYLRKRWEKAFNSSLVDFIKVKGVKFITINSMAVEGNGLELVEENEAHLSNVQAELEQDDSPGRPIVLQHFPFYRQNDDICNEIDSQKGKDRLHKFTPGVECLSPQASDMILKRFNPRLIFNGHIHAGCVVNHTKFDAKEWTVASFNWRNRQDPNFLLLLISPDNYAITKCFLPSEFTLLFISLICLIGFYVSTKFVNRFVNNIPSNLEMTTKSKTN